MIASLPMYDLPEIRCAVVNFWQLVHTAIADHGLSPPSALTQGGDDIDFWLSPALCLSQTCGLPYRLWLHDRVGLVGTANYALDDCPPGFYRSAVVVRADDQRNSIEEFGTGILAVNSIFSQSGYAALRNHLAGDIQWSQRQINTGSHLASLQAIRAGKADIAAIDAVTWRLVERYDKIVKELRVLTYTEATPGLPYITAQNNDTKLIFAAIDQAMDALPQATRDQLGIRGLVFIDSLEYLAVPTPPEVRLRQ